LADESLNLVFDPSGRIAAATFSSFCIVETAPEPRGARHKCPDVLPIEYLERDLRYRCQCKSRGGPCRSSVSDATSSGSPADSDAMSLYRWAIIL
jgi:hypothetical protein